ERALRALQREGIIELRRGVGYFVRASPEEVDHEVVIQELTALEDSFLRAAAELGFNLDDVIIHLDSRRRSPCTPAPPMPSTDLVPFRSSFPEVNPARHINLLTAGA